MNLRMAALIFGMIFLGAGVAWHMPFLFTDGMFLGIFDIDLMHNRFHMGSGLIALAATYSSYLSRLYFKCFGCLYALLGFAGFFLDNQFLSMDINLADNLLHLAIGAIALLIGFKMKISPRE